MRKPALVALWLIATAATSAMAFWAVMSAGSEVSARPATVALATPAISTSPSTTALPIATMPPTTTAPAGATAPPPTTSAWNRATINSPGGSIIVSYRPFEVRLESVAPLAGFGFEIDDEGPERVRVEFFADDESHTLRAEWQSEGFRTDVDSSGEGSNDDDDD